MPNAFQSYLQAKQQAFGRGVQMEHLDLARRKMEMAGRPEAGFTLSPGQVRYGPGGQRIAGQAVAPELKLTKGQEALDRKFGQEYAEYTAGGGYADVQKQLNQLGEVYKALGTYKPDPADPSKQIYEPGESNLTGSLIGRTPDVMLSMTEAGSRAIAARDTIEEVVQRNLRLILGAQFTEKEGERLIARAYNPKLGEEENKKRVGRLIKQIQTAAEQKQRASEYFEQNGTLKGFQGHIPSKADFDLRSGAQEQAQKFQKTPTAGWGIRAL